MQISMLMVVEECLSLLVYGLETNIWLCPKQLLEKLCGVYLGYVSAYCVSFDTEGVVAQMENCKIHNCVRIVLFPQLFAKDFGHRCICILSH